ncbi:MAG: hypothetical protein JWN87_818 [Frankiales bacterium]|nr:hypothetical protein [Frankiales bacterium]
MIVISGALVLVALVLLVIGLIDPNLGFVYASIAVSLASFGFLVVGILQRRKEVLPETADVPAGAAAAPAEGVTAIIPSTRTTKAADAEPAAAAADAAREAVTGQVLVVAGRPRYHVAGCRYLTGKQADTVDVADAREEGFTACGVCKPDLALAEAAPATAGKAAATPAEVAQVDEVEVAEQAPVKPARVTKASAAKVAAPAKKAAAKAAPATKAAPAKAAAPAKKAPAKASPAKKAAAAPAKRGGVVVIPDRGKFHTAECRYVRGAEDTLELSKAAATRQGYEACGVCNP